MAALDRLSRALQHEQQRSATRQDLSPVQVRVLLFLLHQRQERRRVGELAAELALTAATVSDSVRVLVQKGLVRRLPFPADRRGHLLELTPRGRAQAERAAPWTRPVEAAVSSLPQARREGLLEGLLELIAALNRAGVITVARTCLTCRFFEPAAAGGPAVHRCRLMDRPLAPVELRVNCPDHEPRAGEA